MLAGCRWNSFARAFSVTIAPGGSAPIAAKTPGSGAGGPATSSPGPGVGSKGAVAASCRTVAVAVSGSFILNFLSSFLTFLGVPYARTICSASSSFRRLKMWCMVCLSWQKVSGVFDGRAMQRHVYGHDFGADFRPLVM
jgi:hypothetical protein